MSSAILIGIPIKKAEPHLSRDEEYRVMRDDNSIVVMEGKYIENSGTADYVLFEESNYALAIDLLEHIYEDEILEDKVERYRQG